MSSGFPSVSWFFQFSPLTLLLVAGLLAPMLIAITRESMRNWRTTRREQDPA